MMDDTIKDLEGKKKVCSLRPNDSSLSRWKMSLKLLSSDYGIFHFVSSYKPLSEPQAHIHQNALHCQVHDIMNKNIIISEITMPRDSQGTPLFVK